MDGTGHGELAARLRASGSVFAEDEARELAATARDGDQLAQWVARRAAGELLEQIVGRVALRGEHLRVGPGVFVPRQRTALLIDETLRAARARERPRVLEMYAGAAPVAALVARRLPAAIVHVAEIDERALALARENLPRTAHLHHGDAWEALPARHRGTFDVIAAVPPYVPAGQLRLMPREVREHEPHTALLGGADGMEHIRSLLAGAPDQLAADGILLLEMHRSQAEAACADPELAGRYAAVDTVVGADGDTAVLRARTLPAPPPAPPAPSDLVLLRRVRDRMDREHDRPLDVEALAAGVHLSAGHLSRRFREEYGESPYSYLMTRRVERAMTLLRSTDRSVTEICMAVGFSSLGTFSTRFRELVGVPPSTYRARGADVLDSMPPCIARRVTRPIRNREAPRRGST